MLTTQGIQATSRTSVLYKGLAAALRAIIHKNRCPRCYARTFNRKKNSKQRIIQGEAHTNLKQKTITKYKCSTCKLEGFVKMIDYNDGTFKYDYATSSEWKEADVKRYTYGQITLVSDYTRRIKKNHAPRIDRKLDRIRQDAETAAKA